MKQNNDVLNRVVEQARQESEARMIIEKDRGSADLLSEKRLEKTKSLSEKINSLRDELEQKKRYHRGLK